MSEDPIDTAWNQFDRTRDASAFERFYIAARDLVGRLAYRALGDPDLAADVAQSMFARLWMDPNRRPREDLTPRQAVIRWTLDEARTARRRRDRIRSRELPIPEERQFQSASPPPDRVVADRMMLEKIRGIVATLPEHYQQAILVCEFEGLTHREAGDLLGLSPSTVKSQVRRGMAMLSRRLQKVGITLGVAAAVSSLSSESHALSLPAAAHLILQAPQVVQLAGPISASSGAGISTGLAAGLSGGAIAVVAIAIVILAHPWKPAGVSPSPPIPPSTTATTSAAPNSPGQRLVSTSKAKDTSSSTSLSAVLNPKKVASASSLAPLPVYAPRVWHGRVLSLENGLPIPNATVTMFPSMPPGGLSYLEETDAIRSTRTDSEGEYRIQHAGPEDYGALRVEADGFASVLEASFTPRTLERNFGLVHSGTIRGRVVDADGNPCAGALVGSLALPLASDLQPGDLLFHPKSRRYSGLTWTDSEGRFRLDGLPLDQPVILPYRDEGSCLSYSAPIRPGTGPVELKLPRTVASLRGRVLEAGNRPLMGGWVNGLLIANRRYVDCAGEALDADGSFQLHYTTTGTLRLYVYLRGATDGTPSYRLESFNQEVDLLAGDNRDLVLHTPPPLRLSGRVVGDATGEPIAGVRISHQRYFNQWFELPPATEARRETISDADGRFTLTFLRRNPEDVTLYFLAPGPWVGPVVAGRGKYESGKWRGTGSWWFKVPKDAESAETELRLTRGATLRGTLVGVDGKTPVPNADIGLMSNGAWLEKRTDGKGLFSFRTAAGTPVHLFAYTENGFAEIDDLVLPGVDKVKDLTVPLSPAASVSGQVLDENAVPVPNRLVRCDMGTYLSPEVAKPDSEGTYKLDRPKAEAYTDANGNFVLHGLIRGTHVIRAEPAVGEENPGGEASQAGESITVDVEPGQKVTGQLLHVARADGRIRGIVTDESGVPIVGARIYKYGSTFLGQTDEKGRFQFTGLPGGRVISILVTHPDFGQKRLETILPDAGVMKITLARRKEVLLCVKDNATGHPISPYRYRIGGPKGTNAAEFFPTAVCKKSEGTNLLTLPPGEYAVAVDAVSAGAELNSASPDTPFPFPSALHYFKVPVGEGGVTRVDVTLAARVDMTGRVIDGQTLQPIPGTQVRLTCCPSVVSPYLYVGGGTSETKTDADGRFQFHDVQPARYVVRCRRPGNVYQGGQQIDLTNGKAPPPLTLRVEPGGSVRGTLKLGPNGSGACSRPEVSLTPLPKPEPNSTALVYLKAVDTNRQFAFEGVPPGRYIVEAASTHFFDPRSQNYLMSDKAEIEVVEGEVATVPLSFESYVFLHGRVLSNGSPNQIPYWIQLIPTETNRVGAFLFHDGPDSYRTMARPGEYRFGIKVQGLGLRIVDSVVNVSAGVGDQVVDVDIPVGRLDVEFKSAKGRPFGGGDLFIHPAADIPERLGKTIRIPVSIPRCSLYPVPAGDYVLSFESGNGGKETRSPVEVSVGRGERTLAVLSP